LAGIDFTQIFIQFAVLILSLSVHEAAHAWSAERLGDTTARMLGRVSLNPAVHVDPIGTILFPLIGMLSGAPIFGWAKPVPVNIMNLRGNWKRKYMLIAAAGPASNIVLATIGALALGLVHTSGEPLAGNPAGQFLVAMVELNVLLAVFNMVPLPPLDGGNVLAGVLRGGVAEMYERIRPYGFLILYGLLFSGILWRIIGPPYVAILSALRPLTTAFG
jgi:Zn-dependent protease